MKRSIVAAAMSRPRGGPRLVADPRRDGEVRAVSVAPASGKVDVVIDLQGAVEVQDFTLDAPARLVVDLLGARLAAPATLYDGQNRGGVREHPLRRSSAPAWSGWCIDLERLADYQIQRGDGQVRVEIGSERTAFGPGRAAARHASPAAAPPPPAAAPDAPPPRHRRSDGRPGGRRRRSEQ